MGTEGIPLGSPQSRDRHKAEGRGQADRPLMARILALTRFLQPDSRPLRAPSAGFIP